VVTAGFRNGGRRTARRRNAVRYTTGTEFYLATGDICATRQLLGHADVSTTANIYVQGSSADPDRSFATSTANEARTTIPIEAVAHEVFPSRIAR
jgi:hypothetical protein